jgi:hypothetical protein
MRVVSGDNQYVSEHREPWEPVVVEVADADGQPLPGVVVSFAAGAGSGYVPPREAITGVDGTASWREYVHAVGQQVEAKAGGASVTFGFQVQATGHPFDGWYQCDGQSFEIRSGLVQYQRYLEGAIPDSFVEATGELHFAMRVTRLQTFTFDGAIAFEPSGRARATGATVFETLRDSPSDDPPLQPILKPAEVCLRR